jgi:hypothetical protein
MRRENDMSKQVFRVALAGLSIVAIGSMSIHTASAGKPTPPPPPGPATPMQVFGAWHCGNHYCDWSVVRDMAEFDTANHWLIDSGDGHPSVNLVVLSFVNPLRMLNKTDTGLNGMIPRGMDYNVVEYFKIKGIRVMLSIGGITYTDDWDAALAEDPTTLGQNAAQVAAELGVGIEIDYENSSNPNLVGLQKFVDAYRARHPYDATGANPAARLTIDVGAGDRWLIALNRYATANWLRPDQPVLDYANAMVSGTASGTPTDWQEHVDGKPQYAPPVPPLAPAKFTGGLYLKGNLANCTDFASSEQKKHATYLQSVTPKISVDDPAKPATPGMLGYMFWAAEYPSARKGYTATVPPNSCEGGMGVAATTFKIPIPMPALRQR